MQPYTNGSTSTSHPNMSSAVPLLRPPVPGGRAQSGGRTPRLGLSIPASPNARPVVNGSNEVQPSLARPMPPALRLATPMGSNTTPQEGRQHPRGLPPLRIGTGSSAGGSSDASADSRSGSVGEHQANGSASSYQATLGFPGLQTDPISAISQGGSEGASAMERENSSQPLPDLDALAAEKGRPLEVDDLDEAGWRAASAKGMIEELGSLGEGAGGAVTKSRLKGGKTTFALKVRTLFSSWLPMLIRFIDHHHRSQPRREEANRPRAFVQQELRK
jgi:mitogen-activated protein kinase kinase